MESMVKCPVLLHTLLLHKLHHPRRNKHLHLIYLMLHGRQKRYICPCPTPRTERTRLTKSHHPAVYATLAQICANAGNPLTTNPEATFSATSGGSVWPTSYSHSNPYSTAAPTPTVLTTTDASGSTTLVTPTPTSVPSFWAAPSGPEWTSGAWSTGPWTSWWNHASATNNPWACPGATWPGWTSGAWSTAAPWTSWHGCSASTTATSVVTTTDSAGVEETSTSFGVVVKAAADTTSSASAAAATGGVAGGVRAQGGVVGIAVIAAVVLMRAVGPWPHVRSTMGFHDAAAVLIGL